MNAMILAAGRGNRMRPLTDITPKPLLEVDGQSLIDYHLNALAKIDCHKVIINVCYKAQHITAHIEAKRQNYPFDIVISDESQQCLGTGGGIYHALPALGDKPFLLLSADIFTDFPLDTLPQQIDNLAHLIMVNNPHFHPKGDFSLDANGILHANNGKALTYGNIAIINPKLFIKAPTGPFPLSQLLKPAIAQQQITGELYQGLWDNVGTPAQLTALNLD